MRAKVPAFAMCLLTAMQLHAASIQFNEQFVPYGVDLVRARAIWPLTRGENINVVVMDTGIDYRHFDVMPAYAGGVDIIYGSSDPGDTSSHGTGIAGVIAAADNAFGTVGVAPSARLWSVKTMNMDADPRPIKVPNTTVAGFEWVIEKKHEIGGHWIVNCSFAAGNRIPEEEAVIERAIADDILVIAGAGNANRGMDPHLVVYPAGFEGVLGVGAVDRNKNIAWFSLRGPHVSVVAPGVNVLSEMVRDQGEASIVTTDDGYFVGAGITGRYVTSGEVSGTLVDCGSGGRNECPKRQPGFIAFVRSSPALSMNAQANNVIDSGAAAVVFEAERDATPSGTLVDDGDPDSLTRRWPIAIELYFDDAEELLARSGRTVRLEHSYGDYTAWGGTSFATPHVAGVAALLWSLKPSATAADIRNAITATAIDLGPPGRDDTFGYGLVDALAAAQILAPERFNATRRRSARP